MTNQNEVAFKKYFELLQKWNSKMSLMSVSGWEEFKNKHIDDALKCVDALGDVSSLLDLGSGAGVPAIPIKIAMPSLEVVLLDSTRKKISFCEEVIRTLGLENITAVWGRAEDEGLMKGLGAFDVVVSRATWDLNRYLDVARHYAKVGGRIVAMKGPNWKSEEDAARTIIEESKLTKVDSIEYSLADGESRTILVYERGDISIEVEID